MKLNYNLPLALAFGALANCAANKPIITNSSPPVSIVTIPCNTTSFAGTGTTTALPFSNTTSPATPTEPPPGTLTVPCIKCPESPASPGITPMNITTTTFVTVPCSTEVESVPSQPVAPPLNTAPTNVIPPQDTPVPAFPSGPIVPSKAVPGASTPAVPAPPAASSRPAGPPSPAPSPSGPPRPPAFTGAGSVLSVNPRGTIMAIFVAALAIF